MGSKLTNATITLIDFRHRPRTYMEPGKKRLEIKQIKNSTKFMAGDLITAEQADTLILQGWTVIINKPTEKDYS